MTQRQLDLALLIGIGVLLLTLLILALSGAPRRAGDIGDPVARVRASAQEGTVPEPVAREASPLEQEGAATPALEREAQVPPATGGVGVEESAAPQADGQTIERVGFAYVTGGEGACGVVLEPWQHIAVSRDLLARYPCGTAVTLALGDEIAGRQSVTAQVGDTMGPDITDTVNIFVAQDEPALDYGVTRGTLRQ